MKTSWLTVLNKTSKCLSNIINGKAHPVAVQAKRISPHISSMAMVVVDKVARKSDYLPDVVSLHNKGYNVKVISKILSISESYCYKLLKSASGQ